MFKLSEQVLKNVKSALRPTWEPALAGPQIYSAGCSLCSGLCKQSCKDTCRGLCKNKCTGGLSQSKRR